MHPTRRGQTTLATLFGIAAIVTYAAVALGSLVCATDSSAACPNWPGCYVGQVLPAGRLNPVIEFTHRVAAVSTGPILLAAALAALPRRHEPAVRWLPWVALAGALAAGIFGMLAIRVGLTTIQAAADLGCSLIAMIAMITAAQAVRVAPRRWAPGRTAAYAWGAVALFFVVHVSGVFAAGPGSLTRCVGCPAWTIVPVDGPVPLQIARIVTALAALALTTTALLTAWRAGESPLLLAAAGGLVVLELAAGVLMLGLGATQVIGSLHAVTMVTLLAAITLVAARATIRTSDGPRNPQPTPSSVSTG